MNESSTDFKLRLRKYFGDNLFLSLKISNKTDCSFTFNISKFAPGIVKGFERGTGHIKGTYTDSPGYKKVVIQVRPNILWFGIFLLSFGSILYNAFLLFYINDIATTIFKITAFVFVIIVDYILAKGFSDNIKDNFDDFLLATNYA